MRRRIMKQQVADAFLLVPISRILLVDEDQGDREYHANMLEGQGHHVVSSSSFDEGRRLAEAEEFDVAFVSQGGPAFESRSLVERLRAPDLRTPVVVLSQIGDVRRYMEAMQLGALDYLEKPVESAEMRRILLIARQPALASN